jgi:hypothetical protein
VDQVDSEGVHYVSLTNITGPDGSITTGTTLGRMDYETLYRFFEGIKDSRVFSQSEFQERLSLNKDDVFDPINVVKPAHEQLLYDISLEDDNTIDTLEHLKHKLNDLDSSGREYDFRVGL